MKFLLFLHMQEMYFENYDTSLRKLNKTCIIRDVPHSWFYNLSIKNVFIPKLSTDLLQ